MRLTDLNAYTKSEYEINLEKAINEIENSTLLTVTGSKTLALSDLGEIQKITGETIISIPLNASVPFENNTEISFISYTTGDITFSASVGVTLNSVQSMVKMDGQYSATTLKKIDTNEWLLFGSLKA